MTRVRRVFTTFAPPLLYLVLIFLGTRPPKAVYKYATPTVMTVTDHGGPTVLHSPPVVYPPQALRAGVEGSVTLQVAIAADGTVTQAVPVSGPCPCGKPPWTMCGSNRRAGRPVGQSCQTPHI